jgi:isopenicillin-N epimerase
MRSHFTLNPDITFLNHGSFGAMPIPVRAAQQAWRDRLERQPVLFLGREVLDELRTAMATLAAYVGGRPEEMVFVPNATFGVNVVARSLEKTLQPGDEILGNDHEYGACANAWEAVCRRTGAHYVRHALPMPDGDQDGAPLSPEAMVELLWAGVTPRTRVIFLSHITSPTAVRLPVEEIAARARAMGILTLVDGAHAPGQLDLNLAEIGADFYTGNCHKWLCAPKGAALLQVRPEHQHLMEPLSVSWGSEPHRGIRTGNDFQDAMIWHGTDDPTAYLSVPAAIAFQQEHNWAAVRAHAAATLDAWLPRFADLFGLQPVYREAGAALRPPQLAVTPMPAGTDGAALKRYLYDEWQIEVPVTGHGERVFVRVSFQGYNSEADLERLENALDAWGRAAR